MVKLKVHFKIFIGVLLFLVSFQVHASQRIVDVDFEGLVKVKESSIRSRLTSYEGKEYSSDAVNADIKALYQTGFFQDVYVGKKSVAGGIHLIFYVQEKGIVRSIVFKGNKKFKDKELLNILTIREHSLLDQMRIAESEEAIRKHYEEKGFYLVQVSSRVEPLDTETNDLELFFEIQEQRQVKIKRISFVGNKVFSDRKLAKQMLTKVKGVFSFISSSGKFKDEKLERDQAALTYFYLNHGFIKVKVGNPQLSLTRTKQALYITIPVYEGPKYKIGKVGIDGDVITTKEELQSKLKLKTGDVYSRMIQDQDVQLLTRTYGDQAYAFANIYPVINTHDEDQTADVVYSIQKGPKIVIERIEITGNTITRDKVIRRELQVLENAPYSKTALDISQQRLYQLGYFEDVNFSTPRGSRDNTVVLVVKVKEKPTGTFSVGAGFSSLESFIFTATVQKDNFFGYGISGGLSVSLSKLRQEFMLQMSDRYFLDTRWIFSGAVYRFSSALNQDFNQKSFGGSASFGRELFPHFDMNIGYKAEDVEVTDFSVQVPAFFQQSASGFTSSIISNIAYDTRDNRLMTTKGMYHGVFGQYAGSKIGSDNEFWKIEVESKYFFRLPLKSVLKARGKFGYINSMANSPVPLFERFFLGGINTLRGYNQATVGPQISIPSTMTGGDSTFTYGGNRMLLFNAELELPIYDAAGLKTVVFFDAGQAFAEEEDISFSAFRANYGFGLRWLSPFGPLRFEWGFPIERQAGESFSVFNFSIGQSF